MDRSLLQRWLSQRVGYCVCLNANDIGRVLYDGKVFYDLLDSYGLVSKRILGEMIGTRKKTPDEALRILFQLSDAFYSLGITVDKDHLRRIAFHDGIYAVRLLYQLYLKLEDKQFLKLLAPQKRDDFSQAIVGMEEKFHARDLIDGEGAAREMAIVEQYDNARNRIIEHCAEEIRKRRQLLNTLRNRFEPIDFKAGGEANYYLDELAAEEEGEYVEFDPVEYVKSIKARRQLMRDHEKQPGKAAAEAVVEVCGEIIARMEEELKGNFREKIIKLWNYEKEEALKWTLAHDKFMRFFNSRLCKYVDSDEDADDTHLVKNEILRRGGEEIAKKEWPKWQLHKKLWGKRVRKQKRSNYEMARHIVQDLIEIVMKVLLYRYENKRAPVPRKLMNVWKEAFLKGTLTAPPPRVTLEDSSICEEEALPEEEILEDICEIDGEIFIDREVIKLINEFNLHCYLYLVGPWDLAKWPEWDVSDEELTVNGFIVHRLLETKYPLPKRYQDPKFNFKFASLIGPIKDHNTAYIYNAIRNLLTKSKVVALDIIEPMNHCLNVFHAEADNIQEAEAEITRLEAKQAAGGKRKSKRNSSADSGKRTSSAKAGDEKNKNAGGGRKSMGAKQQRKSMGAKQQRKSMGAKQQRKSMGAKQQRKSLGGKKGDDPKSRHSLGGKRKSMGGGKDKRPFSKRKSPRAAEKVVLDKAVQCPSVDELIPRVNHSPAGLLGKEAFEALVAARPASDLLSVKMLVEYLKAKRNSIDGFALISYPVNVSQAVLLEFLLTGRPIKTDYKISPEIASFIQKELRPQPYLDTRVLVDFEDILSPDLLELSEGILDTVADKYTASVITNQHRTPQMPPNLERINAVVTSLEDTLNKQLNEKAITEFAPGSAVRTHTLSEEKPQDEKTKFHYPDWNMISYNKRDPLQKELTQRLRTDAYNLGRFRPMLSAESYEKMKTHVFALMAWLRSPQKVQRKPEKVQKYQDEEEEGVSELSEQPNNQTTGENATTIFPVRPPSLGKMDEVAIHKPGNYLRPISYVDLLKLRSSEIMPRPNKDQMEVHYNTSSFFQKYIKCLTTTAARKEEEEYLAKKVKYKKCIEDEIPGEECVLDRIVETEPASFYKVYGKKEVCDYDALDYDSITKICRIVLNEIWGYDDPLRKKSLALFDEDTLKKLMRDLPGKKKTREKSGKHSGGKRASKSGRKSSVGRKSSAGRKSAAGPRKSAAGGRKSAVGRKSAAGARKSNAAGPRKSAAGGPRKSAAGGARKSTAGGRKSAVGKKPSGNKDKKEKKATGAKGQKEEEIEPIGSKLEPISEETEELIPQPAPPPLPPPPPPKPGESGWEYVEQPIPDIYQIYLATTWESIEFEYLSNLLYLFYIMRAHDNKVIPYRNFIREAMEMMLLQTDDRMEKVTSFQKSFNDISSKSRKQDEEKRNLRCRIYDLYNDLADAADRKKDAALVRKEDLLNQRWVPKHIFRLANLFLNLVQIETNRTIHSLQLIHDYYFAMMEKPPTSDRLQLFNITRMEIPKRAESIMSVSDSNVEKKTLLPWEKAKEETKIPDFVLKALKDLQYILENPTVKSIEPNPAYPLIYQGIDSANAKGDELFDYYENMILDAEFGKELRPKITRKLSPEEERERKRQERAFRKMLESRRRQSLSNRSPSEDRQSSPRRIRKKKLPQVISEDLEGEIVSLRKPRFHIDASKLQMVDRLKWEWLVSVKNEINRLKFRLELIKKRAEADMDEVLTILKGAFDEFSHDIGWQYRREIRAIEDVIGLFKVAADLEVDVPIPIILDGDQYFLGNHHRREMFPEVPPPPNSPVPIIPKEFTFTLTQLNNFIRKIEDISPDGIIDRCFISILEDMAAYNVESKFEFLPSGWSELKRDDIRYLLEQAFGTDYIVNWRDFLLFCSGLRYPTVEEMVELRMRFQEIDKYGFENIQYSAFMRIPLWYEKDLVTDDDIEWGQEMKKLLFKLFRTSRKEINYTELLLTLCKGKDPEEGLGKALSLMLGTGYIFWPDPPDWIHPRHVVDYVLIQILHDVILKADYPTVVDYVPSEERRESEESQILPTLDEELGAEEMDETEMEKLSFENVEEEMEEENEVIDKYKQILWRTCVPYEACLALLLVAMRFWELPASYMLSQIDVETRLKRLFREEGVGSHIKAYKLAKSQLLRDIFHNTSAFKECNMPEMVYSLVKSKHHLIGAKNALDSDNHVRQT